MCICHIVKLVSCWMTLYHFHQSKCLYIHCTWQMRCFSLILIISTASLSAMHLLMYLPTQSTQYSIRIAMYLNIEYGCHGNRNPGSSQSIWLANQGTVKEEKWRTEFLSLRLKWLKCHWLSPQPMHTMTHYHYSSIHDLTATIFKMVPHRLLLVLQRMSDVISLSELRVKYWSTGMWSLAFLG